MSIPTIIPEARQLPGLSRRRLLALSGTMGAGLMTQMLLGCSTDSTGNTGSASPVNAGNPQPVPVGTVSDCTVVVSTAAQGIIGAGYCSLSYEKDSLWKRTLSTDNTGLVALFKLLNASSLMRVGGNSVDSCLFAANGSGKTSSQIASSDMDAFAAFLQATNTSVIYGINLKKTFSSPASQTAALAVAEANYAVSAFGPRLNSFEIGNEPDIYTTSAGAKISFAQYRAMWEPIALAIRSAQPNIPLSGPALASDVNVSSFAVPFAADESAFGVTLLTQHRYVGDAASASSTDATLLADNADSYVVQQMQKLNSAAASIHGNWRMAETGTYFDSAAGKQAKDFTSALWLIDYLFINAANGGTGINLHGGSSFSFSPINDNNGTSVTAVNAVYYGALLFSMAGQGTVVKTTLSAPVAATAYTVQADSTHYNTLIVNKDQTGSNSLKVVLTLPGAAASATAKVLTAPALSAQTGMTLQGGTIGVDGSFSPSADYRLTTSGATVTCYVPYNSAILVKTLLI